MTNPFPSENKYVLAMSENRFEDAKQYLLEAVIATKQVDARPVLSGLAQRFGSISLKQGDKFGAIALYEFSEALDATSLLAKLDYAKFLLDEVGDKVTAEAKCGEIIATATSHPFPGTDDDFSSDEYIEAATRVINKIRGTQMVPGSN